MSLPGGIAVEPAEQADLTATHREGLLVGLAALKVAIRGQSEGKEGSTESIRRIAKSIANLARTLRETHVRDAADSLAQADSAMSQAVRAEILLRYLSELASSAPQGKAPILVVDADQGGRDLLRMLLDDANHEVLATDRIAEAEALAASAELSLAVIAIRLADGDGRDLLVKLREREATAGVPAILLGEGASADAEAECFALGADEFLAKPFHPPALVATAARLRRAASMAREARRDALTGLANRAAFFALFEQLHARTVRTRANLSLALLDVDGLRAINQRYGEEVGDELLRRVAGHLSGAFRRSDPVARWGGDEFAALFPGSPCSRAHLVVDRALTVVRGDEIAGGAGGPCRYTLSVGVVPVRDEDVFEEAIARAERCLGEAKAAGRNRIVVASEDSTGVGREVPTGFDGRRGRGTPVREDS